MKKIFLYSVVFVASFFFITSCEKDEIGGTATEEMAGEWYVVAEAVDASGNVVYGDADLFGLGRFHLDTYNTADNSTTEMWINDNGNFYELNFKVKINIDLNSKTFQATSVQNETLDDQVTVTGGKILIGATKTPSGISADSIVFMITLSDDTFPVDYGYAAYRISGYRYTGFTKDE